MAAGLMASAALSMLFLNSRGLTRPLALLHAAEMPVYILLLFAAANAKSIDLLLAAWLLRLLADVVGISFICSRAFRSARAPQAPDRASSMRWMLVLLSMVSLVFVGLSATSVSYIARWSIGSLGVLAALLAGQKFLRRVRSSTLLATQFA